MSDTAEPTITIREMREWVYTRARKEGERLGIGEAWTQIGKRAGVLGVLFDLLDYLDEREKEGEQ